MIKLIKIIIIKIIIKIVIKIIIIIIIIIIMIKIMIIIMIKIMIMIIIFIIMKTRHNCMYSLPSKPLAHECKLLPKPTLKCLGTPKSPSFNVPSVVRNILAVLTSL
jgi:hypothetical protein